MRPNKLKRTAYSLRDGARRTVRAVKDRKKLFRSAAVIITIAAALLFFGKNGENPKIEFSGGEESDAYVYAYEGGSKVEKTLSESEGPEEALICCDIGGEVVSPGVYILPEGSRLYELIEEAGGLTDNADISGINRALVLSDGAMIRIPDVYSGTGGLVDTGASGLGGTADGGVSVSGSHSGLVNINTAGPDELQTVPGIGPAIAGRIIDYRESMGPFGSIEEIRSVKGIGEKTFAKIKEYICI